jgi:hypothetical protein
MLIAGSINFVVFMRKKNEHATGGGLARGVESIREVTGIDGRVLSSEVFAAGPDGFARAKAPIECIDELVPHGYTPTPVSRWD